MTKATNLLLVGILAILVIGLFVGSGNGKPIIEPSFRFGGYNDLGYSGVTNSSVDISLDSVATSTKLFSNKPEVMYRRIQNVGTDADYTYCSLATTSLATSASISGVGIRLATSGVESIYEIGPDNLYFGEVWCTNAVATATLLIIEK